MDRQRRIIAVAVLYHRRCQRRRHRFWVHPILLGRETHREFHRLIQDLDFIQFQRYFRMDTSQFDELLVRVVPELQDRTPVSERLLVPLSAWPFACDANNYSLLATGDSLQTISFSYRVGTATVGRIVPEVAETIFECLVEEFMPQPTKEDWKSIAEGFQHRWNFPNCLGAIDGKHVVIQAPPNSGSYFYNYKGTFSIVLFAVVDAYYCFRVIDVGGYSRTSDGGILSHSGFGEGPLISLKTESSQKPVIAGKFHVLVGDEDFPLRR
ncbi:Protein ANTAGONIST OF LIKE HETEROCHROMATIN PROTEIN 1 [Merluccius polli]|uniref:Protein ANTAGONIST OF LIKE HETEROCHROMATIN PROTEIN 1 n=1 Tax=Merluccius polli TaxID=89951 RepID=A0AA47N6L0_MERPO|nr:Protein ANTAGONIST OF LIKE HETEROCHROMATIN PROTEIN 1 [Merluccius polli]